MKTKKVYAILPENEAWDFKERVIEQKIPGGINGILKPYIRDWLQKHPRRPDIKKSSTD